MRPMYQRTKMETEREKLDRIRREMRELWERDRLLWYCTLPHAWDQIKDMEIQNI